MKLLEEPEKRKSYKLTVIDTKNTRKEISFCECQHCKEMVPDVGVCEECNTPYDHVNTIENFDTGFIHYVYECSGCPEDGRKAQKIIKLIEEAGKSKTDRRKDLADEFLKSGGY